MQSREEATYINSTAISLSPERDCVAQRAQDMQVCLNAALWLFTLDCELQVRSNCTHLLNSTGHSVKIQPLHHLCSADHGGEGRLVLLLVGQGQGSHGAAVEGARKRDNLMRGAHVGIIRIHSSCKSRCSHFNMHSSLGDACEIL